MKAAILNELDNDPAVEISDVGVTVVDGAVTLVGAVPTYVAQQAAEAAVLRVDGVRSVSDDLVVKLAEEVVTDATLGERIAHILAGDPALKHEEMQASVRDGAVTLMGTATTAHQRETAEHRVGRLAGVRSILNRIEIMPRPSPVDIKREIVRALHRYADIEASHIDVSVEGGTVRLFGRVHALYEKDIVKKAVWTAPGVTAIDDHIVVE
nr:BON domain-containing protein [Acuticoccus kalidii]